MKNSSKVKKPIQYPQFWDQEFLDVAIQILEKLSMTDEQRLWYEMALCTNALAIKNEEKRVQKVVEKFKAEIVTISLKRGKLSIEEIAEDNNVTIDFVLDIQNQLSKAKS